MENNNRSNRQKYSSKTLKVFTTTRDGPMLTWRKGRLRLLSRAGPAPPGPGDDKPHFFRWANGPPFGPFQTIKQKTQNIKNKQEVRIMKLTRNKASGFIQKALGAAMAIGLSLSVFAGTAF